MQTPSPLIPRFKSPTKFAGLPTMGSVTFRMRALHVRASRITGRPGGASQWCTTSSDGAPTRRLHSLRRAMPALMSTPRSMHVG
jgi:hypothetical protein